MISSRSFQALDCLMVPSGMRLRSEPVHSFSTALDVTVVSCVARVRMASAIASSRARTKSAYADFGARVRFCLAGLGSLTPGGRVPTRPSGSHGRVVARPHVCSVSVWHLYARRTGDTCLGLVFPVFSACFPTVCTHVHTVKCRIGGTYACRK